MSDWQDLEALFDELCLLDDDSRRAALHTRCETNPSLRAAAERMLRAYDEERAANADAHRAAAGRRYGAWETVKLLGRGGMGEVWLARRADGQHEQQAAIKILSPYLAAPDSLSRFRRERQLLARLEHPHIARLLDGGMSPHGEPYLVMEYVEGTRLDRYCDEHGLPAPARLELMIEVCAAVSTAHQYLVVHRDLKPANILVGQDGQPKLLDFGIAKVLDNDSTLERTATANMFLTPVYASPEILRGQPATVASDVYSLGVILYELLAGRRPFDAAKLGPAGLIQAVTATDPPPPGIDKDLDSIVLKALARNPEERYGSAAQLADDLRRYLDGLPVAAVARSHWYVARKFVRRNRLAVSAAAVLLLSLAAGLAGTLWQARRARQEGLLAEQRFNDARKLANYLLFDLYDSVGKIPGTMPVQADMASRALQYLDHLAAGQGNDPALRLELARGYLKLGDVLGHRPGSGDTLGNTTQAIASNRKAMALAAPLVREHPDNTEARRAVAAAEEGLGVALNISGRYQEAASWLRQAAENFEQLASPRDARSLQEAGTAWFTLGKQISEKGAYINFDAAAPLANIGKAIGEYEAALKLSPRDPVLLKLLATTYESKGRIDSMPNPSLGMTDYTAALDLLARLPAAEQQTVDVRNLRAMMLLHLGWDKGQLNDFKGALSDLEQARPVLDELSASDPQNVGAAFRRVDLYRSLGMIHGYAGHKAEALASFRQAIDILDWAVPRDPANIAYPLLRAEMQNRVANLLVDAKRDAEARRFAEASVAYFRKIGDSPTATAPQLMEVVKCLAETHVQSLRDYPAALRYALRADQVAQGKNPAVLGYVAEVYSLNGDKAKAVAAAQRGLAQVPPTKPGAAPSQLRKWLEDEVKEYGARP
ncbi:MAG TPA: protein kinase [Bryobacteraceae bacterium]|nr:protein kinase [Bryobacteraceae bacterium]